MKCTMGKKFKPFARIRIFPEVLNYWDWDFYLRAAERFRCKRVPAASVLYAFSPAGGHASLELTEKRQMYLDRLCAKHGLGKLPQKNFFLLLEEPQVAARAAETERVWDGTMPVSRCASRRLARRDVRRACPVPPRRHGQNNVLIIPSAGKGTWRAFFYALMFNILNKCVI